MGLGKEGADGAMKLQSFHPETPCRLLSGEEQCRDGKAVSSPHPKQSPRGSLCPDPLLSYRLRQRPLGPPLQQPVPVPKRSPVQPHHRRLRVCRRLPRLALRGALRAWHPRQGLPAAVPVPPRHQLRSPHRRVPLLARLYWRLVSKARGSWESRIGKHLEGQDSPGCKISRALTPSPAEAERPGLAHTLRSLLSKPQGDWYELGGHILMEALMARGAS